MTIKKPGMNRLFLVAGLLLLLILPVTAVWVLGEAVITWRYEAQAASAGHNPGDADVPAAKTLLRARAMLHVLLLFMVLVIGLLLKESNLGNRFSTAPVRYKLVGLLLYAVALPLAGLIYFGLKYVDEYRELLTQEAFIACHSGIADLENGFEKEKARILNQFRSYKKIPEMLTDPASLFSRFKALELEKRQKWIEVRDINSEVLLTTQEWEVTEKLSTICRAIARLGISRFLTHRLDSSKPQKLQAFEVLIQEFFESPLGGWARVFESPDELHRVSFGGFDIFYFWDIFEDPGVKPAFMVADNDVRATVHRYLSESLKHRTSFGHEAMRTLAWSIPMKKFLPEKPVDSEVLKKFVDRLLKANAPQSTTMRWNNADWLLAGAPGKVLSGSILLNFYPVEAIDRQIARVRSDLFWGVLLALIIAVLIGMLFSQTVIRPVANLMVGVQALRRRDTSHRLQILQNDELGRLSATFNATSETLEDVISAKAIQAMLIPEQVPEIKGFAADLVNLPASDLGGDYCDIVQVGEKWLLVIGDVTGHGVSSALVTAMTKAIVSEYAMNKDMTLNEMFVCLNEMLFSQFRRKKCLTLFAAMLDPQTGVLECINAAHPLPLLFQNSELQVFPKLGCPPLGFSAVRKEFPQAKISLPAGGCLILFTDILIEKHDKTGQPLTSKGLAAICEKFLHLPPAEMRSNILKTYVETVGNDFDDDLTMVILKNDQPKPIS
ncbi:MAG: SpoIIE family protein phosphatase [Candidatus Riflebacteria bacterium]|nr:SpoIIE family protein phosphatase [Candidatus Riflebacteria bacterium]